MPPSDPDDVAPRRGGTQVHAVRAAIVVACFVVATIVLLGPASHLTAGVPSVTTTTTHPPPHVVKHLTSVQVANATSTKNLARKYTNQLTTLGWDALPALDASPSTHPSHTIVYFARGYQAAARLVAEDLGLKPRTSVTVRTAHTGVANADQVDVVVVLGPNLA
jgi:hypothetical protein